MNWKTRILDILGDANGPISTNAVADMLGVHWKTVADELEELYDQGHPSLVKPHTSVVWR